MLLSMYEVKKM